MNNMFSSVTNLYKYRELLYTLSLSYIKARYKQTLLGIGWAVIPSLMLLATTLAIFPNILATYTESLPYTLFIFIGFWFWTLFSNALSFAVPNLSQNVPLLRKVYFPREILIIAAIVPSVVDFLISMIIFIVFIIAFGIHLTLPFILFPILVVIELILIAGLSLGMAIANVAFHDVSKFLPILLQMLLFASPVIYSSSQVTDKWRFVLTINPITGIIESMRGIVGGNWPSWHLLGISLIGSLVCYIIGLLLFKAGEKVISDIV